jgi:hypothetical protein
MHNTLSSNSNNRMKEKINGKSNVQNVLVYIKGKLFPIMQPMTGGQDRTYI